MSMTKNLSTESSEKHWTFVQKIAEYVSRWPAWKQAQFRTIIGPEFDQLGDDKAGAADLQEEKSEENPTRQVA